MATRKYTRKSKSGYRSKTAPYRPKSRTKKSAPKKPMVNEKHLLSFRRLLHSGEEE